MSEKKGIFGFLKGWSSVSEEEKHQRSYAANQVNKDDDDVSVTVPEKDLVTDDIVCFSIEKCEEILRLCSFSGKVNCKHKKGYVLELEIFDAGDDLGRIIGKNGMALYSLQMLLKQFIMCKFKVSIHLVLDAEGYRSRHQETMKKTALQAADVVISQGNSVPLNPMNASDRRFIHMLFEKNKRVKTISKGEGASRRVVLIRRDG